MKTISATEARIRFGELMRQVVERHEPNNDADLHNKAMQLAQNLSLPAAYECRCGCGTNCRQPANSPKEGLINETLFWLKNAILN